jgi:DUF438 domain-containing protein
MSEHINNREYRKEMIKKMITQLHEGKTIDQVKECSTRFSTEFRLLRFPKRTSIDL